VDHGRTAIQWHRLENLTPARWPTRDGQSAIILASEHDHEFPMAAPRSWDAWPLIGRSTFDSSPSAWARRERAWTLFLPIWILFLVPPLTAAVTGKVAWKIFKQRLQPGLCGKCGYDLRASNDRCPECGTAFDARGGKSGGR
jgi:hypothetical protein